MAFSRRRQDIEQALAREGLAGAEAAQNIAHRTRLSKDHRDEESLKAEWRSRAQEYGIEVERHLSQSRERGPIQFRHPEKAGEAIRQSIDENIEREAVIDRRALEAKALQHAMGQADLHRIRAESERFQQDGRLIVAGDSVNSPRGAYTTPAMIALERSNIELMRAGQGRAAAIGSPNEIRRWASQRNCFLIRPLSPKLLSRLPTGSPRLKVVPALRKQQLSEQSASSRKSMDTLSTDSLLQRARSSRFPRRAFPPEPSPASSKATAGRLKTNLDH